MEKQMRLGSNLVKPMDSLKEKDLGWPMDLQKETSKHLDSSSGSLTKTRLAKLKDSSLDFQTEIPKDLHLVRLRQKETSSEKQKDSVMGFAKDLVTGWLKAMLTGSDSRLQKDSVKMRPMGSLTDLHLHFPNDLHLDSGSVRQKDWLKVRQK